MANKIDEAQVRRVALLSRLELSDKEVAQFSGQLSDIVEYIEKHPPLPVEKGTGRREKPSPEAGRRKLVRSIESNSLPVRSDLLFHGYRSKGAVWSFFLFLSNLIF